MKVLIPTAGIGSRMGSLTNHYNKAMIPIGKRPVISIIMDSYPPGTEFVVALGYRGEHIRQYLELAYPDTKIAFVEVDNYDGPGSGLGHTLRLCKECLDQEFVFHANDTIVVDHTLHFPMEQDTLLLHRGRPDPKKYRTVSVDAKSMKVLAIHDKTDKPLPDVLNYIGVAYVKNYRDFVDYLSQISVEVGESDFFMQRTKDSDVRGRVVDQWYDIGNVEQYRDALRTLADFRNLAKPDEAIYFKGSRVYKFSADAGFIKGRVARSGFLTGLVPEVVASTENFYVYEYAPGELLSEKISLLPDFRRLLQWGLSRLWAPIRLNHKDQNMFENTCFGFYYDKTLDRLDRFYTNCDVTDRAEQINGVAVPPLLEILDSVDWSDLKRGVPVLWHGDFHFENILVTESQFKLLDWRQGFGAEIRYGDLYYDLAKLLHGLLVNHEIIRDGQFTVKVERDHVQFDFHRKHSLVECERCLEDFVQANSFSWQKVKILAALVYLNIAALHHYPYSHFLYYLGKSRLWEVIRGPETCL